VRNAIKSKDAKQAFDREVGGAPAGDGLGTQLPAGFTKEMLMTQLAPGQSIQRLTLAGAKPWAQRPGSYVAIVCLATTAQQAARELQSVPDTCDDDLSDRQNVPHHDVLLGVFEAQPGAAPRLVARTDSPVDVPVDWGHTDLDGPQSLDADDGTDSKTPGMPESWSRFDLAPYRLREADYAFGVRAGWNEGYAGGGASFEALYLFHIDGATLRVVFAEPMMFSKMLAGDWHEDGTRDHEESDGSKALVVLGSKTAGFYDLQLRGIGEKTGDVYHWSAQARRYIAK
jgi:hypothetical protein